MCILIWHKRIWLVESRHATSYYYEVCFSLDKQNLPEHVITHLNVERNLVLNYVITGVSWSNIFFASIVKYLTGQFVISSPTKKTSMHLSVCNSQYFYYISIYLSVYVYDICKYIQHSYHCQWNRGPGLVNGLGNWITQQLMQAYHQYGVCSRPAL